MKNEKAKENIIGYMELGDGEKMAISTLNNVFLNYTFEQKEYWETLRSMNNIIYSAYIDYCQHTNISLIEGDVIVKTEYSNFKDFKSTVPQRQDIRIENQNDSRVDYVEFQSSRNSKPPIEVRGIEYFSYSLTRGRDKRSVHMWLLAEPVGKLLHGNIFANYVLMDEVNHNPYPNATNILFVNLERLSQTNSPAGELAGVLLGAVKKPKDYQVKLIFENFMKSFEIFKEDKEARNIVTRGEQREYQGEARAEARLMPIIKEKDEQLQMADEQLQKADEQLQKAENDKLDTAKKLLRRGLSVEDVAEDTGLDYSVVCSLV